MEYDIVIIGAGTAGLSAAVYGVRAGLSVLVIEENIHGGQIINTPDIVNYPAIELISGFDFANNLYNHAKNLGAEIIYESIESIDLGRGVKRITTANQTYLAKTVIIANGARHRELECEGEAQFKGRGVSYCATCDGNFYRGKDVCVAGGGNTALEDALYLSNICTSVHLIHRRSEFRAHKTTVDKVRERSNINLHLGYQIVKISGEKSVNQVTIQRPGEQKELSVSGVFVAIGLKPDNGMFSKWVNLDPAGYIIAGEDCKTNVPGVFVAGDTRTKSLRQLITAASDGAVAATECARHINTIG